MRRSRLAYQERRIDFALQRQRHAREAAPGCGCIYCLKQAEVDALLLERIRLERLLIGEPPF